MVQPLRYMAEVASTKTLSPSTSKVLSIIPAVFSKDMEYENPEQPPPTTPTRKPAGTGFCCPIISFTFAIAVGVREIGAFLIVSCGRTSGVVGIVVVDMVLLRR